MNYPRHVIIFSLVLLSMICLSVKMAQATALSEVASNSNLSNGMCVVFVADNSSNDLLISCSSEGFNWRGNVRIGERSSFAPAAVIFNDEMCVTFVNDSRELRVTCSSDGVSWPTSTSVGGQMSKTTPAIAVFKDQLCISFVADNESNSLLVSCSSDSSNWQESIPIGGQSSKTAPAMTAFRDQLCVVFVANNETNSLLITCSPNASSWSGNSSVGNQLSKSAPAVTIVNGALCVVFVADNETNVLIQTCSTDGSNWFGNTFIRGQRSRTAPATAVFNQGQCVAFVTDNETNDVLVTCLSAGWPGNIPIGERSKTALALVTFGVDLYIAYVADNTGDDILTTFSPNEANWASDIRVGEEKSSHVPSLAFFKKKLCMVFATNNESGELRISCSIDGLNWMTSTSVGGQLSKFAPSVVVFNNQLCVFFVANNETNSLLLTCSPDGTSWSGSTLVGGQQSKTAPSAIVFNNQLCVFFVANNETGSLLLTCSPDGTSWSGNTLVGGQLSKFAPSAVVFNNQLCVFFVANNETNSLLLTCSSDGTNWFGSTLVGGQQSKTAPSAVVFNNKLCVVFIADNETNSILITCSTDGSSWYGNVAVGGQRSKTAPAVISFDVPALASRDINVSVAVHRAVPAADMPAYEDIIRQFADGIYEMSNGAQRVNDVFIYHNGNPTSRIDVRWNASEWPRADISGIIHNGNVIFGDVFPFVDANGNPAPYNALAQGNLCGAGYTLAHEFGHYYYGLYDEYDIGSDKFVDTPVQNSVMSDQWNACPSPTGNSDLNWLNFSIARNNTQANEQHRQYGASGWETLARLTSEDPRDGLRKARPTRVFYSELVQVSPQGDQNPPIELPSAQPQARSRLDIVWIDLGGTSRSTKSNVESTFSANIVSLSGTEVAHPTPALLVAWVGDARKIARATVQATVTAPSGQSSNFMLRDDGIAPDVTSEDGLYSGFMPYNQTGVYTATVSFNNNDGNAVFTQESYHHTIGPNGEVYKPVLELVGQNFNSDANLQVLITGVIADDHPDTIEQATILSDNNLSLVGRIDRTSDKDTFRLIPAGIDLTVLRVSSFAFGMEPRIRILSSDGSTAVADYNFDTTDGSYFYQLVSLPQSQTHYVEISHQRNEAISGVYEISFGRPLAGEVKTVYLPMISR